MAPPLPAELWCMVMGYLDPTSKKHLRLVDLELSHLVAPHLFETVSFNLDEGGVDRLSAIATSESLRPHVHALVLRRAYGLNDFFDGFESWERCVIHEESRYPELENRLSDGSSVDDDLVTDENDVMSAEEWTCLSDSERRDLFDEYERDRVYLREHARQLLRGIYYRPLGSLPVREPSHARATNEELEGSLSNRLDEAVPRLTQLRRFEHYPAYMMDGCWGTRWRRLRFQTRRLVLYSTDKEAERVENLQLALAIRALGLAGELNSSLRVLDIYVAEAAFWGAVNLGRLWNPLHSAWEGDDDLSWMGNELDMDIDRWVEQTGSWYDALHHQENLTRELVNMEHAFTHLTSLFLHVKCGDRKEEESAIARQLFYFLRCAHRLESISLILRGYGWLPDAPNTSFPNWREQPGEAATTLLRSLAQARCFSTLRKLHLSLLARGDDLLLFLESLSPTLRSLELDSVALLPASGRWESVLEGIAQKLQLENVKLRCLEDDAQSRGRLILEPTKPDWSALDENLVCYAHYEDAVFSYVLRRSSTQPTLNAVQFFHQHVLVCEHARELVKMLRSKRLSVSTQRRQ